MSIIINGKEKYRLDEIDKYNAKICMIIGGRNIGKTYAVKERFLTDAWKSKGKEQFAYIRRWSQDLKRRYAEQYFEDAALKEYISKLTKNKYNCVAYKEEKFYFAKINKETGRKEFGFQIGQAFALSMQEHYKSLNYSSVKHGIYEEWITTKVYLPNEPEELRNLLSTIERDDYFKLYMCANTISRVVPYVPAWSLEGIMHQEKGTIDLYEQETGEYDEDGTPQLLKIAVEYCSEIDITEASKKHGIFKKHGDMIKGGEWYAEQHPRLELPFEMYNIIHTVIFQYNNFMFLMRLLQYNDYFTWYVERKTSDIKYDTDRIVGNIYRSKNMWTNDFTPLTPQEASAFTLIRQGHIVFCDNLTGTEFNRCLRDFKL